ncbi:hypothetical protein [Kamptonema formosum]|uniref:hypothetical protein n=1 Tax=Kamptonema formosum TaxID=331992 RepID=UPI00034AA313|nr:hypothetical protein [Oscillatoria sp. PCC 10802]
MQTNTAVTTTGDGLKTIQSIFHWQSKEGRDSHCLLRIYIDENLGRAAVIASELDSNRHNTPITRDFKGLASAVARALGAELGVPRSQITWIVHCGDFSQPRSYENLGFPDEFSVVDFPESGTDNAEGEGSWTVLRTAQIQEILGGITLPPVERVVAELRGH